MAKKLGEVFAMSEEDEFLESGEEGGSDGSDQGSSEGQEGSGDDSGDGTEGSGGDEEGDEGISGKGDEEGSGEGEGGEGSEEGSEEGEEGSGEGEGSGEEESAGEGEEGSGSSGEGEEGGSEDEGGKSEDFFDDLSTESDEDGESGEKPAVSFKKLSSALEIELEEGTEEELAEKIKAKIEAAKQDVDLSKFDPEAKRLVKHLNDNGGKLGDFFVNPKIATLQSVLSLSAEDKFRTVRRTELSRAGGSQEEIEEQINNQLSEMPAQEIVRVASKIDDDVQKMIAAEIEEIVGESEKAAEQKRAEETEKVSKKRESLKNYVQKQDNFLGLKLSDKAKQTIAKDIETGRFDQVVDLSDDEIRFAAYMIKRQGGKITERFVKELAEKSREGYNKGLDKSTNKLHKNKTGAQGASTGHQEASGGKKNFDNWGDLSL